MLTKYSLRCMKMPKNLGIDAWWNSLLSRLENLCVPSSHVYECKRYNLSLDFPHVVFQKNSINCSFFLINKVLHSAQGIKNCLPARISNYTWERNAGPFLRVHVLKIFPQKGKLLWCPALKVGPAIFSSACSQSGPRNILCCMLSKWAPQYSPLSRTNEFKTFAFPSKTSFSTKMYVQN